MTISYWVQLIALLALEALSFAYIAAQYLRIHNHFARVQQMLTRLSSAVADDEYVAMPHDRIPSDLSDRQTTGDGTARLTETTFFASPGGAFAIAAKLDRRLNTYLLVYLATQGPALAYVLLGGHFELNMQPRPGYGPYLGHVPFGLAIARVVTQPLTGVMNAALFWHHSRRYSRGSDVYGCCEGCRRCMRMSHSQMSTDMSS